MEDAECAETNEKSILRFLFVFEIFNHLATQTKFIPKYAKSSETNFLVHEFIFAFFSFWDMVDFCT